MEISNARGMALRWEFTCWSIVSMRDWLMEVVSASARYELLLVPLDQYVPFSHIRQSPAANSQAWDPCKWFLCCANNQKPPQHIQHKTWLSVPQRNTCEHKHRFSSLNGRISFIFSYYLIVSLWGISRVCIAMELVIIAICPYCGLGRMYYPGWFGQIGQQKESHLKLNLNLTHLRSVT